MTVIWFHSPRRHDDLPLPDGLAQSVLASLLAAGEVQCLADLAQLTLTPDTFLELPPNPCILISPYSVRAVSALLARAGVSRAEDRTICLHDDQAVTSLLAELPAPAPEHMSRAEIIIAEGEANLPAKRPWYPVIDPQRCTQCRQCENFCLFGVYAFEDEKVTVANPLKCKNNCPACSKVCPTGAVIFPKCDQPGVSGMVEPDRAERMDVEKLKAGGVMDMLRQRAAKGDLPDELPPGIKL